MTFAVRVNRKNFVNRKILIHRDTLYLMILSNICRVKEFNASKLAVYTLNKVRT